MIPFPFQAGQLGFASASASVSPIVSYRGAGTMVINSTGTTVAPAVPVGALSGDLLVAVIMRRSAVASDPPSGWTLVSTAGPAAGGGINQYTHVYTKTATGAEAGGTVTFTQASSGRIIGQILAVFGSTGTPTVETQGSAIVENTTTSSAAFPSVSASGDGRLALACASIGSVNVSPTPTTFAATGWTLRSPSATVDNRVGIFTKALSSGQNTSGTMTSDIGTPTSTCTTANAVIFASP